MVKTCKKCNNNEEFYPNKFYCKKCTNKMNRDSYHWNKLNREPARKRWRDNNKEKMSTASHKSYTNNKDLVLKRTKDRYENDKEYRRQITWLRRHRIRGNGGSFTIKEWKDLCDKYNNCCASCREPKKLTADHIKPVSRGGTSNINNIQPLCSTCNDSKGTKEIKYG